MRLVRVICTTVVALVAVVALAVPASAAAYTKSVHPPDRSGATLTAWADLSRDCTGTYGCWNYMKIERRRWYGVQFVAGNWVNNNGRNSISTALPSGCFDYRTTVDSYNDTVGTTGAGINVGQIGETITGQAIYRFRTTWSSGFRRYCR